MQVDIVDFNGSFLARIRDLAGANPIILVITKVTILCNITVMLLSISSPVLIGFTKNFSFTLFKVDLLPKGTDLNCVGDWVVEATTKKKLK